ncbi:hypothetical protein BD289DRAFT_439025 [Coniella lustricola]|uniref:Alcohol acetyltransferase n=1 Tax=Coniella lustricola TaxID=2025994 RepID=A0A2T3A263_9PEZI|nr:hypothetical protein BD289DRAFT_439025 [Coniella lustricola]
MDWTLKPSGQFIAELGGVERIYRHVSRLLKVTGREHWGLYCCCRLELSLGLSDQATETKLQNAWLALRYELPGLAVAITDDNKKSYNVPTTESVARWLEETFIVEKTLNKDDILGSYPIKESPTLYFLPESLSMLLLVSHWRIDALGTCMLLNRFLALLAAGTCAPPLEEWPAAESQLARISPPIEDAIGSPSMKEAAQDPALEDFARQYIRHHHHTAVNAGGLPFKSASAAERPSQTSLTLCRSGTSAFTKACRDCAITITSAVHAALADIFFSVTPAAKQYACVMSVNMRNRLQAPYNLNSFQNAVQTYVTGVTPSVGRESSFLEKARQLKEYYQHGWYSDEFARAMRLTTKYHADAMVNGPPPPAAGEAASPPTHRKPPSSVTLSSLGVVDRYIQQHHYNENSSESVTVTNFDFGVSMMTRQILLYVWTFDGHLRLSANYNDAYHDAKEILELLNLIRKDLEKELAIVLDLDG